MTTQQNKSGVHYIMDMPNKVPRWAFSFDHQGGIITCPRCNGDQWYWDGSAGGRLSSTCRIGCDLCDQKGKIKLKPGSAVCDDCHGAGKVFEKRPNLIIGCITCDSNGIVNQKDAFKEY